MWDKYLKYGLFYGITTNPVLLNRAQLACDLATAKSLATQALHKYDVKCFMLQTWGADTKALVDNGLQISKIGKEVVVKVPLTKEGIAAAAELRKEGAYTKA
jgi:transaldolase